MPECNQKAVLIVTAKLEGTATNIARRRVELHCRLPEGHAGQHRDGEEDEAWTAAPGEVSMVLRHEDEA
jgi:hypothetical protein